MFLLGFFMICLLCNVCVWLMLEDLSPAPKFRAPRTIATTVDYGSHDHRGMI